MIHRLELALKPTLEDPIGHKTLKQFQTHGYAATSIRTLEVYLIESEAISSTEQLARFSEELFVDPVLNDYALNDPLAERLAFDWFVEVGYKAGVTDNAARVAKENLSLQVPLAEGDLLASARAYLIQGDFTAQEIQKAAHRLLVNPLIQRVALLSRQEFSAQKERLFQFPHPQGDAPISVEKPPCDSLEQLMALSEQRLLALSKEEARTILSYYQRASTQQDRLRHGLPQGPTDVELECIAQTWSEHCKHKIFNSHIDYEDEEGNLTQIQSLYKTYIQGSTNQIRQALGTKDWCLSVFKDNAGIIRFNEDWSLAFKVETHNSPSALDPYGGALTGIVGVNRDAYGTGMGAKLIANTDVFCFGPPDYDGPLPKKLMHPERIFEGVRLGVEHGGNHSGVPTVNGAICFDDSFVGKPLVFCGTVSLMPAKHQGAPSEQKQAQRDDHILMVGGRIGKDGIHGATFSSIALDENSPVSAVQIGDPITQKRMFDFLWAAKQENLYSSVTDNGAGGLSSSVGEMAEDTKGAKLHLDRAPLKYKGLQPWEILVSEAQERMTLSVPPTRVERFLALAEEMLVEASDLGEFTDSGYLECFYHGELVARLEMEFLHQGLPAMRLKAKWTPPVFVEPPALELHLGKTLRQLLGRPNVASKERVIRQYDHEVGGAGVIKPLMGPNNDAPMDAAALRPVLESKEGALIANGICPKFAPYDTYHMAANAIDEAIRNLIATGGSLNQIAGLDNFCWPDPVESDHTPDGQYKLAQLVRACQAIYDYCLGFGVPCISGKDSMKNDAILEGKKISIKPTLLFSVLGKVEDITKLITSDAKGPDHAVYLLGETHNEMAGSELFGLLGLTAGQVPKVNSTTAKARYEQVAQATEQGLISALHDCSDGGLGVALAEMAFGGGYGMELELGFALTSSGLEPIQYLFSESASRLVALVKKKHQPAFESLLRDQFLTLLGTTTLKQELLILAKGEVVVHEPLEGLKSSWQQGLA